MKRFSLALAFFLTLLSGNVCLANVAFASPGGPHSCCPTSEGEEKKPANHKGCSDLCFQSPSTAETIEISSPKFSDLLVIRLASTTRLEVPYTFNVEGTLSTDYLKYPPSNLPFLFGQRPNAPPC